MQYKPVKTFIQAIKQSDVFDNPDNYNTNNHWINNTKPADYEEVLQRNDTDKWIDKFHTDYKRIQIPIEPWMFECIKTAYITKKFSSLFIEELDDYIDRLPKELIDITNAKFFVRTKKVSLKSGQHGIGPYTNMKDIVVSLLTCRKGHEPLSTSDKSVDLFLMNWNADINPKYEYRIFVFNKKITAISQQNLYEVYEEMSKDIDQKINLIVSYFKTTIRDKIEQDNYVYDFCLSNMRNCYFIETNSFGKEYASGSALYHWINDDKILTNDQDEVYYRYTY